MLEVAELSGMLNNARVVNFACGHSAQRLVRRGASLVGRDDIRCHECGREREVIGESGPFQVETAES